MLAALGSRSRSRPAIPTPFRPVPADGIGPAGVVTPVPGHADRVILYVSRDCPYCAVELEAWADLLEGTGTSGPRVVLSPASGPPSPMEVPTRLSPGVVHDRGGGIARALGVRSVPFVAVLDETGVVVRSWAGVTPRDARGRLLALLEPPSGGSP